MRGGSPGEGNYVRAQSDYASWLLEDVSTASGPATRASCASSSRGSRAGTHVQGSHPSAARAFNFFRAVAWLAADINLTDPSGWIPTSVLRLVMKGIPLAVSNITKFLNTQGPPPVVERLAGTVVDLQTFDAATSEFL